MVNLPATAVTRLLAAKLTALSYSERCELRFKTGNRVRQGRAGESHARASFMHWASGGLEIISKTLVCQDEGIK